VLWLTGKTSLQKKNNYKQHQACFCTILEFHKNTINTTLTHCHQYHICLNSLWITASPWFITSFSITLWFLPPSVWTSWTQKHVLIYVVPINFPLLNHALVTTWNISTRERITSSESHLDAVFEDVAGTSKTTAFPVQKLLAEDDDLFKEKNSPVMKLQLVRSGLTTRLRNKQAVLQQQPALCCYLPLHNA